MKRADAVSKVLTGKPSMQKARLRIRLKSSHTE